MQLSHPGGLMPLGVTPKRRHLNVSLEVDVRQNIGRKV